MQKYRKNIIWAIFWKMKAWSANNDPQIMKLNSLPRVSTSLAAVWNITSNPRLDHSWLHTAWFEMNVMWREHLCGCNNTVPNTHTQTHTSGHIHAHTWMHMFNVHTDTHTARWVIGAFSIHTQIYTGVLYTQHSAHTHKVCFMVPFLGSKW